MPLPRRLEGIGRKLRVEQALWFRGLVELADFFHGNTGLNHHNILHTIEFISIAYVDLYYARACEWTTAWAYQAFERLCRAQRNGLLPGLKWVELRVPIRGSSWDPVGAFHAPGIWNLLKLRGLQKFIVSTPHRGLIPPNLRRALQECTSRPLGLLWPRLKCLPTLLDLMPGRYAGKVVRRHEFFEEVDQFGFLERMYWEMHHRKAVTERRAAWRASAAKAKKRYPLAVRRRRMRSRQCTISVTVAE